MTLGGGSGTVVWVRVTRGQADRYNLTVAHDHTYAVGTGKWVVHNTCGNGQWTPVDYNGRTVYQRDDLIDPARTDKNGKTSLQLMQKGNPPIGPDGKPIVLHRMLQSMDGPWADLPATFHTGNYGTLHINMPTSDFPSDINRSVFNGQRRAYWMWRATDFAP